MKVCFLCECAGIGRQASLRYLCLIERMGSNPVIRTSGSKLRQRVYKNQRLRRFRFYSCLLYVVKYRELRCFLFCKFLFYVKV